MTWGRRGENERGAGKRELGGGKEGAQAKSRAETLLKINVFNAESRWKTASEERTKSKELS